MLASLCYVVLAARGSRYCWPAAFIGSAIFVVVFWQYQLLMESALNIYYVGMAVYGWILWTALTLSTSEKKQEQASYRSNGIQQWAWQSHALALGLITLLSIVSGTLLSQHTDAAFPYLDSFTTWSSLLATWMVAKKVLENWLYWIVIDLISMGLFFNKGLMFTTALFAVYVIIALYGYFHWRALYTNDAPSTLTVEPAHGQ